MLIRAQHGAEVFREVGAEVVLPSLVGEVRRRGAGADLGQGKEVLCLTDDPAVRPDPGVEQTAGPECRLDRGPNRLGDVVLEVDELPERRTAGSLELVASLAMPSRSCRPRILLRGNGLALDWSLLANFRHELPWGLAGGLTPGNVADAVRTTGAPLVDASSGLETAPGVKDVDLIRAFCKAAREA